MIKRIRRKRFIPVVSFVISILCLVLLISCGTSKKETAEEFAQNLVQYIDELDSNSIIDKYLIDYETMKLLEKELKSEQKISEMIDYDQNRRELVNALQELAEEREREGMIDLEFISIDLGRDTVFTKTIIGYEDVEIKVKITQDDEVEEEGLDIEALLNMDGKWKIIEFNW